MQRKFWLAALTAAVLPGAAMAQPADPACVRSNPDSRVEGTVLGAVGRALIGGALGHGTGAVIGGLGGAAAGNAIAGSRNDPCPPGYYRAPPPAYRNDGPPPPPQYGQGYGPGYGPPPPAYGPRPEGYGPPPGGEFWRGAPGDIRQRIDFMQARLQQAADNGQLSHPQLHRAFRELGNIRGSIRSLYRRDGGLTPDDNAYIQARLDHLRASIHWMEQTGY